MPPTAAFRRPPCAFGRHIAGFTALALSPIVGAAFAADLYVGPAGTNDTAAGRGQSLGNPYRTIDYAADRATAGSTVFIRAGTYRETVTPGVSGTANAPITFRAYNDETVVISGLDPVVPGVNGAGQWTLDSGQVYRIQLTASYGSAYSPKQGSQQVFVNGQLMGEARWPNSSNPIDFDRHNMAVADGGTLATTPNPGTRNATYVDAALGVFPANAWTGALLVFNPGYGWFTRTTTAITGNSGSTLSFAFNPFNGGDRRAIPSNGDPYLLMGRRVALDAPGETYFDDAGRDGAQYLLYLYQPGGGSPAGSTVEMRRRASGIDVGSRSHLRFENLTVRAANIVTGTTSANCVFDGVTVEYGAPHWQEFRFLFPVYLRGTAHQFVNGRIVASLDDGMRIEGSGHAVRNTVVSDCLRSGIEIEKGSADILLERNTVHSVGASAFGANGAPGDILYNHAYFNGMFATDLSTIGLVGPYDGKGSVWAYNWMHDNLAVRDDSRDWYGGSAIRLDYGPTDYLIHHNIVWNTTQSEAFALWVPGADNPYYQDAKVRVYNNTVDREIGLIETYSTAASAKGFDVRNNLCGVGFFIRGSSTDATGKLYLADVILKNNIFPSTPSTAIPNNVTPPHLNNRRVAPGWANPAAQPLGYQLLPSSLAINAGEIIPGITDGYLGSAPDIGALESGRRPFIPGAMVLPRDVPALVVTPQSSGNEIKFLVTGLPAGRTFPETALIKVGTAAASNDFTTAYDFDNHTVAVTFTAPSVTGANQTVRFSIDGTSFTAATATVTVTDPDLFANLIGNPGFESGTASGWTISSGKGLVDSTLPRTGGYSGRMTVNNGGIYRTITGLLPNTTYRLSVWGRVGAAGNVAQLFANRFSTAPQINANITAATWQQTTLTFTTGATNTFADIGIWQNSGTGAFDDFELVNLSAPLTGLGKWRVQQFDADTLGNAAAETTTWGDLADPDSDGISNLLEYALDLSPRSPDPVSPVFGSITPPLSLTFTRARADVTYTVQGGSELSDWQDLVSNPGSVGSTVTVPDQPPAGSTRRFLRLRVTAPD